jgi:hypothetical protein
VQSGIILLHFAPSSFPLCDRDHEFQAHKSGVSLIRANASRRRSSTREKTWNTGSPNKSQHLEDREFVANSQRFAERSGKRTSREQMNSCSCLTLLLACVVYWQAKEISRVLKMGIPEGEDNNISLLEHVSPIEWENVILYGQYVLNPDDIR